MGSSAWDEIRQKLAFARAGKPMLVGMTAFLVVVAVAVGHVLSSAAAASDFEVSNADAPSESSVESDRSTLYVHVSGSVANPGLYELEKGSRVFDAVQAAGGFTEESDDNSCNLARVIEDGEHIVIPTKSAGPESEQASQEQNAGQGSDSAQLVNINTATAAELENLPGIGAATAQRIVSDRTANGTFKSVSDLMRVSGIGEKKLAAIADLICV